MSTPALQTGTPPRDESGTPPAVGRSTQSRTFRAATQGCTDPIVGAILSGWRYDISNISPEMRTDYEQHLEECTHCRKRQRIARTIDVLLISVSSLSAVAFLLAAIVIHRLETLAHLSNVHLHLRQTPVAVSLEAVAIAGLVVSTILWILVAIATPLSGYLGGMMRSRLPEVRERLKEAGIRS